jgi:dihydrofolate reductase
VLVAHDIETALGLAAKEQGDTVIAGGAQVYAAAMPYATEQVITRVYLTPEGDVLYPPFNDAEWAEVKREPHEAYDRVFLTRVADR